MRDLALAGLLALAACHSEARREPPQAPAPVAFDGATAGAASARIAHGDRLASVLGCRGCHGSELQGNRFYELYASNLTRDVARYSDAQLERLIRAGIHPSGRDVWGMPSEIFQHLSDSDLAAITAFLRSLKAAGEPTGKPLPFEPATKKLIAEGKLMPAAQWVQKAQRTTPPQLGGEHALGRYITMVTCAECHGADLKGTPGDTPDLIVVGAYSGEEFERLITHGIPPGGRKLKELMTDVARDRFAHLTPRERAAVFAYLKARAEQSR